MHWEPPWPAQVMAWMGPKEATTEPRLVREEYWGEGAMLGGENGDGIMGTASNGPKRWRPPNDGGPQTTGPSYLGLKLFGDSSPTGLRVEELRLGLGFSGVELLRFWDPY